MKVHIESSYGMEWYGMKVHIEKVIGYYLLIKEYNQKMKLYK